MDTILTLIQNNAAGIITTLIAVVIAYIKSGNLKDAIAELDFLNPSNEEVTTAPGTKYNVDISWKMGDEQKTEIFEGLSDIEIKALTSEIELNEMKGLETYELSTSKGTYVIENGYIEKRPSNVGTYQVIQDSDGRRIGELNIIAVNQSAVELSEITELSKSVNQIDIHGRWINAGATLIGVKVGDEDIQTKGLDSETSQEFDTIQHLKFKLWNYTKTLTAGKPIDIIVYQGYKRTNGLGHPVPEWTSEKTYTFDVVD